MSKETWIKVFAGAKAPRDGERVEDALERELQKGSLEDYGIEEYNWMSEKGTIYFFTGLAGAGKTTIGGLFYQRLKEQKPNAVLIDGDQSRTSAGHSSPNGKVLLEDRYTTEARKAGAFGIFRSCRDLADQGCDVVVCSIAMYHEVRAWNRENTENYRAIYIKVTLETLYRRDQKKLYSTGAKNVVGVDLPWDEPGHSNIVVQNDGQETPEEIVERLLKFFGLA